MNILELTRSNSCNNVPFVRIATSCIDPDHTYLDVNLYNNSYQSPTGASMQYVPAEINQTRSMPYLKSPGDANLTLARFSISSNAVPRIFQPSNTTIATTTFFVGLSYNGIYYTQPILLPPLENYIQMPQRILYNINAFLDLINSGYLAAQTAAIAGGAPAPGTGATGAQVIMTFDRVTEFYTVNVPSYFGTGTVGMTAGNGIGVHMSFLLYERFNSFNVIQNSPLLYGNGHNSDITFVREWTGNNLTSNIFIGGTGSGPYMALEQDAPWGASISNINRLQITVNQIPINQEFVETEFSLQEGGGPNNVVQPILTDFLIGSESELSSLGQNFIYVPDNYRITTLNKSTPLITFTIKCYVVTQEGIRIPLFIPPGGQMSMKLLFLAKGLTA